MADQDDWSTPAEGLMVAHFLTVRDVVQSTRGLSMLKIRRTVDATATSGLILIDTLADVERVGVWAQ